jgi:hypothetical protein
MVFQTRLNAANTTCINNLKAIGLGMHYFAVTYDGRLPRTHASGFRPHKDASWFADMVPYTFGIMDETFFIDPTKPIDGEVNRRVVDAVMHLFQCPENPKLGPKKTFTHYVGITGVGRDADMLPLSDSRCGFFGFERTATLKDLRDGAATTVAVIETATGNGPWAIASHATARGLDPEGSDYLGVHGQFNSLHRQGAGLKPSPITNACFADGSVRGLRAVLSSTVFEALTTIAGGEPVPPPED